MKKDRNYIKTDLCLVQGNKKYLNKAAKLS